MWFGVVQEAGGRGQHAEDNVAALNGDAYTNRKAEVAINSDRNFCFTKEDKQLK